MAQMPAAKEGQFAEAYCKTCEAGWYRRAIIAGKQTTSVLCKLDMQPVSPGLTECDNYELKERRD